MSQSQVCKDLSQVNIIKSFNAFDLNDNGIFYQQIDPVTTVQSYLFKYKWHRLFFLHPKTILSQRIIQTFFVGIFQQSWSELIMHLHGMPNYFS